MTSVPRWRLMRFDRRALRRAEVEVRAVEDSRHGLATLAQLLARRSLPLGAVSSAGLGSSRNSRQARQAVVLGRVADGDQCLRLVEALHLCAVVHLAVARVAERRDR